MTNKIKAKLKADLEIASKATKGPWYEREDLDYYQAGTYLGVDGYRYGNDATGKLTKLPVDCEKERADSFEKDVCRIESDDYDKRFIAHSRNVFESRVKALEIALGSIYLMQAMAGHPSAEHACRNIIAQGKKAFEEIARELGITTEDK
jgi:hypothetical protein